MSEKRQGGLDAVKMARAIRDELSRQLRGKSHREQREYIRQQLSRSDEGKREEPRQDPAR